MVTRQQGSVHIYYITFENRWQKEILEKLEASLAEAEVRMEAAEKRNEALDLDKLSLGAEVAKLEAKREEIISRMSSEEQQVVRWVATPGDIDFESCPFQDKLGARASGEKIVY